MNDECLDELKKTYEGKVYIKYWQRNSQKISELEKNIKMMVSENNLTATVAKGFLEYMKLVIDGCSCLPKEK